MDHALFFIVSMILHLVSYSHFNLTLFSVTIWRIVRGFHSVIIMRSLIYGADNNELRITSNIAISIYVGLSISVFVSLLSSVFLSLLFSLIWFHVLPWLRISFAGRWLSCAQPRQCPKILTLYQRKKEVCSVRSRGNLWQRSRLASPRKRPGRKSFSREERKARYETRPYALVARSRISNFLRALTYIDT